METNTVDSTWPQRSEDRLAQLLSEARRRFISMFPEENFDSQCWDATGQQARPSVATTTMFTFSVLGVARIKRRSLDNADALPAHFINVVKAQIVLDEGVSSGTNSQRLQAAKHFWYFLCTTQEERAAAFKWSSLAESDFLAYEQFLKGYRSLKNEPLSDGTIYSTVSALQELANFLWLRGICRPIKYIIQTNPGRAPKSLSERERDAEQKLPAPGVLETIGDIYYRITTAPKGEIPDWHLILISAAAIEPFTGFRPGELLTLPYDCEVEEKVIDKSRPGEHTHRYGLRYWVSKKRVKFPQVKWITPTAEPLVRDCIKRIKDLTAEARHRAVVLEAEPNRVPLPPDLQVAFALGSSCVSEILGYKSAGGALRIPESELPRRRYPGNKSYFFDPRDVELYLLGRRVKNLYTIRHQDGTLQTLSESLFITFAEQSHLATNPCRLLVEPVTYKLFQRFLSCPGTQEYDSVFTLYGSTPAEKEMSLSPNSFRHWFHHIAYKGGLVEHLLGRYFARDNPQSSRDYLHYTPPKIGEYVRADIRAKRVFGDVATTYWSLPEEQREDYLIGQVSVGHVTPWGLCVRNFAIKPCDKHLNCLNNCSSFVSTKGDPQEISALLDLQSLTGALLKEAAAAEAEGAPWEPNLVIYTRKTLAKIEEVLAVHLGDEGNDGDLIRPFKEGNNLSTM